MSERVRKRDTQTLTGRMLIRELKINERICGIDTYLTRTNFKIATL